MMKLFIFLSIVSGLMSYLNLDPMKSSFLLILSLLMSMPLISFSNHIWYSYFICLLFLSGIFVILVYFSSLSKISLNKNYFVLFCLLLSFMFVDLDFILFQNLNLDVFYYSVYWLSFFYILFMLIFFMNFSSYYLSFSGALRKL